ncbi:ArnT family glycosyltransferase [Granulicella sibirica]|uniref:Putative O-linked GlcNAc transferase-putative TPR-containing transmembrane protein n=1 Tax=Granulicella sibirica TaxID=2479048 RepID=A0A4Q0SYR4_9BACT|nr:glycosyltransferase family 39 protein [Granulicella sibirica]RXH55977.1 putative O-linked GlcNAc transferase-putative TPR-containing transmembrane protein [Granulicella sibirica]
MQNIGPGYWTKDKRRSALWVVLAMAAGLVLRLWMIAHGQRVNGDSLIYGDIAKNLYQHGVFGFTGMSGTPRPTLLRLPGFPLFLAGCFAVFGVEHYRAVMYVQAAIDLATCGLVAGTAGWMYGRRAWWAALWLGALCPFTAEYTGAVLTETLSIFCVAAAFYGMTRWQKAGLGVNRWAWVVGASLAYAVLLRPEQGLLAAALVPTMAWITCRGGVRRGLSAVALTALLVVAPLAPWAARNWIAFHVFQPLAPRQANDPGELVPFGFMRWYRTFGVDFLSTDEVYWRYDSDPINVADLPSRAFDSRAQYRETAQLLDEYNQTTTATAAFDTRFAKIAEDRIRVSRFRYSVVMPVARLLNMLFRPRTELLNLPLDWWAFRDHRAGSWVALGFGVVNLGYFLLAALGVIQKGRGGVVFAMALFCLLRCAMLATIDNSEPRYTLELFPVLVVWASAVFAENTNGGRSSDSYPA